MIDGNTFKGLETLFRGLIVTCMITIPLAIIGVIAVIKWFW